MSDFKVYDPVAQLIASGGGGPSLSLPLTGGTLTGNLTLTAPAKVIQCQNPVGPCDLVNLQYLQATYLPLAGGTMSGAIVQPIAPVGVNDLVNKSFADGAYQAKQLAAVSNNVAIFGSGPNVGQTIDSTFSIDTGPPSTLPSNTTLWPSTRVLGSFQYGATIYKATASIQFLTTETKNAFSTGNDIVGTAVWPGFGSTFALDGAGVASITNSHPFTTYFLIRFEASNISSATNDILSCQFYDTDLAMPFGVIQTLKFDATSTLTRPVSFSAMVGINTNAVFNFSVRITNPGLNTVTLDPTAPDDVCLLTVQRIA